MGEPDDAKLLTVAESISDGVAIDWEKVDEPGPQTPDSEVLRELQLLDRIATFHRSPEPSLLPSSEPSSLPTDASPTVPPAPARGAGDELGTWGHLAILEKIGEGAFGTVYRARDSKLQREVALKLLWPATGQTNEARALKEARLLARLRHPNVATVHGADQIRGRVGLWMEFVKGRTLAEILRTHGPLGPREAALVGLDLCRALAAVHGAGLLHGDVKAHNVMREEGGRTVLMDFGTGKDLNHEHARARRRPLERPVPGGPLDQKAPEGLVDDFAGTPLYLAPEVFEGGARTRAADIYSLGVLLFHLVTDSYPVEGRTRDEVGRAHRNRERRNLRDLRPDLPEEFVFTIERSLAVDPGERYQTAGAVESALARFLGATVEQNRSWISLKWRRVAVTAAPLAVVAVFGVAAYWIGRDPRTTATDAVSVAPAGATAASRPPTTGDTTADGNQPYTINTALYRESGGQEVRLRSGARVEPGDQFFVEVRASVPTYVYIVNEDEKGESFLLFPLPGQNLSNPLPPDTANRLPGMRGDRELFWKLTKEGGREHFLIFASPQRLSVFEQMFAALPRADANHPVESASLSSAVVGALRSVGGLATSSATKPPTTGPLTLQFSTPLSDSEETTSGLWVRQLTLGNPAR